MSACRSKRRALSSETSPPTHSTSSLDSELTEERREEEATVEEALRFAGDAAAAAVAEAEAAAFSCVDKSFFFGGVDGLEEGAVDAGAASAAEDDAAAAAGFTFVSAGFFSELMDSSMLDFAEDFAGATGVPAEFLIVNGLIALAEEEEAAEAAAGVFESFGTVGMGGALANVLLA